MKKALIGYTGFVGTNLDKSTVFQEKFNSKNIDSIVNSEFGLVINSGVRAEKFLANKYPEKDLEGIDNLVGILKKIKTKKFVHISTIDVYNNPLNVDENTTIDKTKCQPYGLNRLYLEEFVKEQFADYLIVRLPALYGKGLKKNFIYDMRTKIPSMILGEKFNQLVKDLSMDKANVLKESYDLDGNGNYLYNTNNEITKADLINILETIECTSLVFTDSRSEFPFYDLSNLWSDIEKAIANNVKVLNISVEPVSAREIAENCFNEEFSNIINGRDPVKYDMKSIHYKLFNGENGYLYTKDDVVNGINNYLRNGGF
ncbi:NAD-dependent epimerase/dehydratase family protein [Litchfieldia alkalitelluris]|uniref:NAD-dependent epimerase/dehydratase family protein n=1 Tax=Litchfieldia alkalitelluris TaxID=304268 RepID=UPI0009987BD9|nr:NAD-dependent epimerase/dehydratase family protein [Litchfieldia alkalitelluris]